MAVDQWLLDRCHAGLHPPALRFYQWDPAAISIGRHQQEWPQHWQSLTYQNQPVDLVRRPTGGRGVLHAGDLTYSLVLPGQSGQRRETYRDLCEFLIKGWQSLGVSLKFGTAGRGYHQQIGCFESATAADLVQPNGRKLIGSAQAWKGQTVLQHGSMQLQPDLWLQQQVFGTGSGVADPVVTDPTLKQQRSTAEIVDALTAAAVQHFNAAFTVQPLTAAEWAAVYGYLKSEPIPQQRAETAAESRQ